ncbi:MAG TPA: DUF4232 domain-containing protein [Acidimicrobiales bacterium]
MSRGIRSVIIFIAFIAIIYAFTHHHATPTTTSTTTTTTTTAKTSTTLAGDTCKATDFTGTFNQGQGAAGTIYASVTLVKSTAGTCTLFGWPLITLQDKFGAVLPSNLVDVPTKSKGFQFQSAQANAAPTTLTLGQNGAAIFSLAYSDVQTGTTACENAVTLSVQFAQQGAAIAVTPSYPVVPCNDGQIWVSPFY